MKLNKLIFLLFIGFGWTKINAKPLPLDTIKTHCTVCQVGNFLWGDHDDYYEAKKCPKKKKNDYLKEHQIWFSYVATEKIFWHKLYDTNDKLIFEGMCYSDCRVGQFMSYFTNGQIRIKGCYDGNNYDPIKGYTFKNCDHKKTGEWTEYSETGQLIKKKVYP